MATTSVSVTVVQARGLRSVQRIGIQDPYVVLRLGAECARSDTHDNGGAAPVWLYSRTFGSLPMPLPKLEISVMNDNWLKDKAIGVCLIDLASVFQRKPAVAGWFPVTFGGEVYVKLESQQNQSRTPSAATPLPARDSIQESTVIVQLREENDRLRGEIQQLRRLLPQQTFLNPSSFMEDITIISSQSTLHLLQQIGAGVHGTVWRGLYKNEVVAIKSLDRLENRTSFRREVSTMFKLKSSYTLQLLAIADLDSDSPKLVLPYMNQGNLRSLLDKRRAGIPTECELTTLEIALAVANGLVDLHKCNVIHRDLKPQNILLDGRRDVRVADFGIARENGLDTMTEEMGSPWYMAPEAFSTNHYGTEVDIYALGVLLTELDTLSPPYDEDAIQAFALLEQVTRGRRPLLSPTCPPWYRALAMDCMADDPVDRPTAAQVAKRLRLGADSFS
ncbi:protein kinase [Achlya hypogyna]|uniref:Protein kinase n=1 Tax=Achlya hypogyna TaxID=1202772 RepID=A0A1V9YJU2_ACHHY|nr:protein kinase [Achlya hypogyna]